VVSRTQARRAQAVTDREAVEREIAAVQTKITRVDDSYFGGELPRDRHDRLVAQYDVELVRLRAALDEFEPVIDAPPVEELVAAAEQLDELWPIATPGQRNELLRACGVTRVTIRRGERYREPVEDRVHVTYAI
jgi:hypothetical protein